uniref:uncharacterized protein LOC120327644 n=1 Tax=Styela clava TaxID=7725 RepID=UPI001939F44B|nr:uncharacterized protein LOC120327644 [Styela clava]
MLLLFNLTDIYLLIELMLKLNRMKVLIVLFCLILSSSNVMSYQRMSSLRKMKTSEESATLTWPLMDNANIYYVYTFESFTADKRANKHIVEPPTQEELVSGKMTRTIQKLKSGENISAYVVAYNNKKRVGHFRSVQFFTDCEYPKSKFQTRGGRRPRYSCKLLNNDESD